MTGGCVGNSILPWHFDRRVFPNLLFLGFYQWKVPLTQLVLPSRVFLPPFYCFSVPFRNSGGFLTFWLFRNHDVIIPRVVYQKMDFRTYFIPSKFHCHCLNILKVTEGGGAESALPAPVWDPKRPGLNRVKSVFTPCLGNYSYTKCCIWWSSYIG